MRRLVQVLAVGTLAVAWAAMASAAVPKSRVQTWERLQSSKFADASVRWDPEYGTPASIVVGERAMPLAGWAADPERAVVDFLRGEPELFGRRAEVDDYRVVRRFSQEGVVEHVLVQQTYRGLPVIGAEYSVAVRRDGTISMIAGRAVPGLTLEISPAITGADAAERLRTSGKVGRGAQVARTELAVLPSRGAARLVHHVTFGSDDGPSAIEACVAADDGSVLRVDDHTCPAVGRGYAYLFQPTGIPTPMTFRIADPGGVVTSDHFVVRNARGSNLPSSASNDWLYSPNAPTDVWFDMVQAYALADTFVDDWSIGTQHYSGPLLYRPLTINVNELVGTLPASASPSNVYFSGAGSNGKSPGRDPDMVLHELQHYLTFGFGVVSVEVPGQRPLEGSAMHEGTSNYFACSFSNDPIWGEWFYNSPAGLNSVANPASTYNYGNWDAVRVLPGLPNYLLGMIWSGTLWDVRTRIGTVADALANRSMAYWPSHPTMPCGGDALLAADRDFYGSAHDAAIHDVLTLRGLAPSAPVATIEGPSAVPFNTSATWTINACCGMPPYTYQWSMYGCAGGDPGACGWTNLGTGSQQTTLVSFMSMIRCVVTDSRGATVTATKDVESTLEEFQFPAPTVTVTGPDQLAPGQSGTFTAIRSGGRRPYTYTWMAWLCDECPFEVVGNGTSVTIANDRSFQIGVSLVDGDGRGAFAGKVVSVSPTSPPALPPVAGGDGVLSPGLSLLGLAASGPERIALRLVTESTGPARVDLYDLAGRHVRRLFEGEAVRGENRVDVSTAGLPVGMYLARSRQGDVLHTARVGVVR